MKETFSNKIVPSGKVMSTAGALGDKCAKRTIALLFWAGTLESIIARNPIF
ncbi:hypothetical protein [Aminipila terrae]|uniref:hypothetical protein n=1 Tax=Aminipila terrae TaxID=2697030 RepID=UPI001FAD573E|nr:hypothetical protein [Aminipila terrae]